MHIEKKYFCFSIKGPNELHDWLISLKWIVEEEIAISLQNLKKLGTKGLLQDQEEILVYLHYMYFYRFALPAIEAGFFSSTDRNNQYYIRFQLLVCLLGRFLDDLSDKDSGFWSIEEASYLADCFNKRCMKLINQLRVGQKEIESFLNTLRLASLPSPILYTKVGKTAGLNILKNCPLSSEKNSERVPYYFWLFDWYGTNPDGLAWLKFYIETLFFWFDVDDIFSDILNNVATEPAYEFLMNTVDNEGRIKIVGLDAIAMIKKLISSGQKKLNQCFSDGVNLGFLLGPSILNAELNCVN